MTTLYFTTSSFPKQCVKFSFSVNNHVFSNIKFIIRLEVFTFCGFCGTWRGRERRTKRDLRKQIYIMFRSVLAVLSILLVREERERENRSINFPFEMQIKKKSVDHFGTNSKFINPHKIFCKIFNSICFVFSTNVYTILRLWQNTNSGNKIFYNLLRTSSWPVSFFFQTWFG